MAAAVEVQLPEDLPLQDMNRDVKEDANNNKTLTKTEELPKDADVVSNEGPEDGEEVPEVTSPNGAVGGATAATTVTSTTAAAAPRTLHVPTLNDTDDGFSRSSSVTGASAFTESQLAELRASFDECDKEKTGFISVGDLESVVGTLGLNIGPEAIREMIDRFDLKRSGEIDFDEFVEMMGATTRGGGAVNEEEEIRQIFRVSRGGGEERACNTDESDWERMFNSFRNMFLSEKCMESRPVARLLARFQAD